MAITPTTDAYGNVTWGHFEYTQYGWVGVYNSSTPAPTPAPQVSPAIVTVITGIDPTELANATYGKVIPIFVGGKARIGGSIIAGPYFNGDAASFAISFGFPANPEGTRVLYEIALDSKVVWTSAAGTATISSGTFPGTTFTARFYPGTYTQAADPIETTQWGANAVAYRPQMVIWFDNLPLTAYQSKIPFVSAMIGDTTDGADPSDGINLGEALERLGYSPWVGMTTDNFATTTITDVVDAMILAEEKSFVQLLRDFARVYRSWDILQTDKLRVIDRGSNISPDIILDRTKILNGPVTFARQEPSSVAGELELITVDPDADYMQLPSIANRPREPYRVSGSRGRESMSLPIVINASTRQALVTYMKFAEEQARRRVSLTVTSFGMELEPGDFVQLQDLGSGIEADTFKVRETSHNGDYTVALTLEAVLRCKIGAYELSTDPFWQYVVFLDNYTDADGATTHTADSGHVATFAGTARIDTESVGYGSSALRSGNSFDFVGYPNSATWDLAAADSDAYTIEWSQRLPNLSNSVTVIQTGYNVDGFEARCETDDLTFFWNDFTGVSRSVTSSSPGLVAGQWQDICIEKNASNVMRFYIDGTMVHIAAIPSGQGGMEPTAFTLKVGANAPGIVCYTDRVRITKGAARYDSDAGYIVESFDFPTESL